MSFSHCFNLRWDMIFQQHFLTTPPDQTHENLPNLMNGFAAENVRFYAKNQ